MDAEDRLQGQLLFVFHILSLLGPVHFIGCQGFFFKKVPQRCVHIKMKNYSCDRGKEGS